MYTDLSVSLQDSSSVAAYAPAEIPCIGQWQAVVPSCSPSLQCDPSLPAKTPRLPSPTPLHQQQTTMCLHPELVQRSPLRLNRCRCCFFRYILTLAPDLTQFCQQYEISMDMIFSPDFHTSDSLQYSSSTF